MPRYMEDLRRAYPKEVFIEAEEETQPFKYTQRQQVRQRPGFRYQRTPRARSAYTGIAPTISANIDAEQEVESKSPRSLGSPRSEGATLSSPEQTGMEAAATAVGTEAGVATMKGYSQASAIAGGLLGLGLGGVPGMVVGGVSGLISPIFNPTAWVHSIAAKQAAEKEATTATTTSGGEATTGEDSEAVAAANEAAVMHAAMVQSMAQEVENEAQGGVFGFGGFEGSGGIGPSSGGGRGEANVVGAGLPGAGLSGGISGVGGMAGMT